MPKQATAFDVEKYLVLTGIPRGPKSKVYLYDPVNGSDNNRPGNSFQAPLKTLEQAEDMCVANQHDAVVAISGATADNPTAAIAWDKNYTHLIGLGSELHGMGQRSRIVGTAARDLTPVITFSGNGCKIRNIQIFNGKDADSASGAAIVSGNDNEFKNVFFAGMGHATPAARTDSYSLKLTGSENLFERCAIGLDTILRAAANCELWVSGNAARNSFVKSRFLSYSETQAKMLVLIDGMDRWIEFEDCKFQNFSQNWATTLTNVFNISLATTHQVIFNGKNQAVGFTGWGDTLTHMYSAEPVPATGFGISVNPAA